MSYFYDLHCHTIASVCAPGKLKNAVRMAKRRGVEGIAITDHDKVYKGPLNIEGVEIIPGTEITTKDGDHLIAYFVEEDVEKGKSLREAVSAVHQQGGYAVLAHPLRKRNVFKELDEDTFRLFDGMESGNATDIKEEREAVSKKCKEWSLFETAGSDAHVDGQVGMGVLKVPNRITKENFLDTVIKGEVVVRKEINSFSIKHNEYQKITGRWKDRIRIRQFPLINNIFTRLVIRNIFRINNTKFKRARFNYKKESQ